MPSMRRPKKKRTTSRPCLAGKNSIFDLAARLHLGRVARGGAVVVGWLAAGEPIESPLECR